ncbi:MAG: triose-phosphate isomerase [Holosporaceae bacterium]|nr:MAG: triose-phosphate isomerase [Holosporaceae bacterium]
MEKFIVGNWKMNLGDDEGLDLLKNLSQLKVESHTTCIVSPPFTILKSAQKILENSSIFLGAQDCAAEEKGAFTGEISPYMLKMAGCTSVIVGHSERRKHHGETSDIVRRKAEKASLFGLLPIICVGETLAEYEAQKTLSILKSQVEESVPHKDVPFLLAYEPVWSIGTGKVPKIEEIEHTCAFIANLFESIPPILYGGSVSPDNVKSILKSSHVNGVLVGGASLNFEQFKKIINNVTQI